MVLPRPMKCRKIDQMPVFRSFSPDDTEARENVYMSVDEFEALRLMDDEGLTQEQCAEKMNVARTTVTAIYDSARRKTANAMVYGKRLLIIGGNCVYTPSKPPEKLMTKGKGTMRIAVTYQNGEIFEHFGHTEQFKLYDVEDGKITAEQIIDTDGCGHGALAGFLKASKVDALICGGIGMGAQMALHDVDISLYGGVKGSADEAVRKFVDGKLEFDPEIKCDHHEHHGEKCGHKHEGKDCGHKHEDKECGHKHEAKECCHKNEKKECCRKKDEE